MTPTQEEHYYLSKSKLLSLLDETKENCAAGHMAVHITKGMSYDKDYYDAIRNAPSPELPEAVKEEPYGYEWAGQLVNKEGKDHIQTMYKYKDSEFLALYTHPSPGNGGYSLEDIKDAIVFGMNLEAGNIERDYKKFPIAEDQFIATLAPKEQTNTIVWPSDEELLDVIDWIGSFITTHRADDYGINDILELYKKDRLKERMERSEGK